jgi:hypothetical protein
MECGELGRNYSRESQLESSCEHVVNIMPLRMIDYKLLSKSL